MGFQDTAQICLKGHVVNSAFHSEPNFNEQFCKTCGAETITACQNCQQPIRGDCIEMGVFNVFPMPVPAHCRGCGKPYPWQESKTTAVAHKPKNLINLRSTKKLWLTAVGGIVTLGAAVGNLGNWWKNLPDEWREWLMDNVPHIELKITKGQKRQ